MFCNQITIIFLEKFINISIKYKYIIFYKFYKNYTNASLLSVIINKILEIFFFFLIQYISLIIRTHLTFILI